MDNLLGFSRGDWSNWEASIRESLSRSGFDKPAIDWICRDMAGRWLGLSPANPLAVAAVPPEHAAAAQVVADAVQARNNRMLLEMVNIIIDIEIDLYYAMHPPTGGRRLRLVA